MLQHQNGVTLLDVRDIFDELIAIYPTVSNYLDADADIVKNHEFEAACTAKMGFADRVMKKRKIERKQQATFPAVKFVPPTSNCVERFFSRAKHTLSHHRHGMLPVNLGAVLFLKENRRFWGANTVMKVVNSTSQ
ncbi:hypothetical protein PHYSODRAFT_503726 [Phytophthora sojae]|uniref:HAT C-terminal dimerisation domain-containing protein n=1 Tax=Phytophthora sojae (strain P6497) TaxID=1094619 RepID=G4ZIG0_PHYSP|nr:hypothetical protein PHYSODRAFT_503726 [Phytophthora sojae]EGZ16824.1 hypothetical protein PHYSODRAFT_503726 [Phytophthora sojae]|eukprot:XP_009525882.1 hypothetical protein PHYSODRAFT_503726 [Phytophthora sojae]